MRLIINHKSVKMTDIGIGETERARARERESRPNRNPRARK